MSVAVRPRSLGEILDGAFRLLRADFGLYALTAVVGLAPGFFFLIVGFYPGESTLVSLSVLLLIPVTVVLFVGMPTALTHQMDARLQGGTPELGLSAQRGLRLIFRLLWSAVLGYLLFFVLLVVPVLVTGVLAAVAEGLGGGIITVVLVGLGVVATVATGVWWMGQVFIWLPIMVVEDMPAYSALKRSRELVRGGSLTVGIIFFLVYLLITLPSVAIYGLTGSLTTMFDPAAMGTVDMGTLVVQQLLGLLVGAVTFPFMMATMLLTYYDRRVRNEGYDLETATETLLADA